MKLVSLHINGFGNLQDFNYDFEERTTKIVEDNGYGKSTLVAFIVAMFYGLDVARDNSNKFSDREHFYPFNQGSFGGSIKFIYQGDEYVLERKFDAKSLSKDILSVYKNNQKTKELGEIPGETIFKINKDNFSKFLIINAKEIEITSNNDINQHISNYANNLDDISLEDALENNKKVLRDQKKQITDLNNRISHCVSETKNLNLVENDLVKKRDELSNLILQQSELDTQYQTIQQYQDLKQKYLIYDEYLKSYQLAKEEYDDFTFQYKVPDKADLEKLNELDQKLKNLQANIDAQAICDFDQATFDRLNTKFNNNLPTQEDMQTTEQKIFEINALEQQILDLTQQVLEPKYNGNIQAIMDANISSTLIEKYREYLSLQNELTNLSPLIEEQKSNNLQPKAHKSPLFLSFLIVTILLFVAGVSLIFFYLIPGIVSLAIGVLFTFITIFIYFNKSIKNAKTASIGKSIANPDYQKKQQELSELISFFKNIFQVYGYHSENNNITELFEAYKKDQSTYDIYQEQVNNLNQNKENLLKKRNLLENDIKNYLQKYGFDSDDLFSAMNELKNQFNQYVNLQNKIQERNNNKRVFEQEVSRLLKLKDSLYVKYNFEETLSIIEINDRALKFNNLLDKMNKEKNRCINYQSENNLLEENRSQAFLRSDLTKLDEERKEINNQINNLRNEILHLESNVDSMHALKNLEVQLHETLDKIKYSNLVNNYVNDEIIKARDYLNEKYVKPIKDKFVYYAKMLEDNIGEKVKMDNNYTISFERNGVNRDYRHLSSGNLSLCAFAFRLAILDNVFSEEKPFIILDDPFVYLDNNHLDKAFALTDKLAKDFQIIYLSCRDDR